MAKRIESKILQTLQLAPLFNDVEPSILESLASEKRMQAELENRLKNEKEDIKTGAVVEVVEVINNQVLLVKYSK